VIAEVKAGNGGPARSEQRAEAKGESTNQQPQISDGSAWGPFISTVPVTVSKTAGPIDAGYFTVSLEIAATLFGPHPVGFLTVNPLELSADVSVPPVTSTVSLNEPDIIGYTVNSTIFQKETPVAGDTLTLDGSLQFGPLPPPRPPAGGLNPAEILGPLAGAVLIRVLGPIGCQILGGGPEDPFADACSVAAAGG
jgi:hypothetical protein